MAERKKRCGWCDENSDIYVDYHDNQWGVPLTDDRQLFEMLILEGMQAGLSWVTILKKREGFSAAFDNFDYVKVARYDEDKITELLANESIVRNRLKIQSAVQNARVFLDIQREQGSFASYLWKYVNYIPQQNCYKKTDELPAKTDLSEEISKDLKKRGMNFVGPTIIYALMQAIGMVNDHEVSCFRYKECRELGKSDSSLDRAMSDQTTDSMYYDVLDTELGLVIMAVNDEGLLCHATFQSGPKMIAPPDHWKHDASRLLEPIKQMKGYFSGQLEQFDLPLAPVGTEFQQKVWQALTEIPYGETITYGELAMRVGRPQAGRAVGNANGRNPIVIVQPCHRVVAAGGKLGGFSSGLHRKEYLLGLERRVTRLF